MKRRIVAFKVDKQHKCLIDYLSDMWRVKSVSRIIRRALQVAALMTEFVFTGDTSAYIKAKRIISARAVSYTHLTLPTKA